MWVKCTSHPASSFKLDKATSAVGLVVALILKAIRVSCRFKVTFLSFSISLLSRWMDSMILGESRCMLSEFLTQS